MLPAPCLLTINAGSSSVKFALFEFNTDLKQLLVGKIEGIGGPQGNFIVKGLLPNDNFTRAVHHSAHHDAVESLLTWIRERLEPGRLQAVGHRVVSGGPRYRKSQKLTAEVLSSLRKNSPFDPEHLPQELMLIDAIQESLPELLQIACFDTEFHQDMPHVARRLPIPRHYDEQGVQRYGFHGLSCRYVVNQLTTIDNNISSGRRLIIAHLGNGASVTAVNNGKCIDTSMSFSPCGGLVMGSRSGDLDPGLAWYLEQTTGMTSKQFHHMVNHRSGLLGISEISSDMRELLRKENTDARAAEAIAIFCYQTKKWICALAGALGGIDTLVFTGGIGENLPQIRARICEGLEFIGIDLNDDQNGDNASVISRSDSTTTVRVIRTDEEWVIAQAVFEIAGPSKKVTHENAN